MIQIMLVHCEACDYRFKVKIEIDNATNTQRLLHKIMCVCGGEDEDLTVWFPALTIDDNEYEDIPYGEEEKAAESTSATPASPESPDSEAAAETSETSDWTSSC